MIFLGGWTSRRGTVSKIIKCYLQRGTVDPAVKSGRPRKTSLKMDHIILRKARSDPKKSAVDINKELREEYPDVNVSDMTVRRRLLKENLYGRRAVKKPLLTKRHRMARLKFARDHKDWTQDQWASVVFSDESKFNLFGSDSTGYVRRPPGQRFDPKYLIPTVKHGGENLMVWGCFRRSGTGPLVRIDGRMDAQNYVEILEKNLLPYEDDLPLSWIFQQDNDPKHTSRLVKNWLSREKIRVLDWPSQSPDLNPIENLWMQLEKQIRKRQITNREDLWVVLQEEWHKISIDYCAKIIDSIGRRCQTVIKAKGWPIKY